jgi:hypothetical protein
MEVLQQSNKMKNNDESVLQSKSTIEQNDISDSEMEYDYKITKEVFCNVNQKITTKVFYSLSQ